MSYQDFLSKKVKKASNTTVSHSGLSSFLFPYQQYAVERALEVGNYGLFEDCGMGKTVQQLEWADKVSRHTGEKVLIVSPLAVRAQTIQEAETFGYDLDRFDVINYESLHKYSPDEYAGVVLDESSILKNFTGKMRNLIINAWSDIKYKLACTATPSPNDQMELCNHAEFFQVMTRSQMLSMYFVNDMQTVQKWRLKGHAVKPFYKFMASWSLCAAKPSDLGFDDSGYELPGLHIHDHQIKTPNKGESLFNDVAVSATDFNKELRRTMTERVGQTVDLVSAKSEPVIVWCRLNEESEALAKAIPGAVEVKGSDKPEEKERRLLGFAKGDFQVLVTKPKIAQYGLNYQHCPNQVFASLDFSFESLYQAIRRSYRFGQKNDVNIDLITTDSMQNVRQSITHKMNAFEEMRTELIKIQKQCFKSSMATV